MRIYNLCGCVCVCVRVWVCVFDDDERRDLTHKLSSGAGDGKHDFLFFVKLHVLNF